MYASAVGTKKSIQCNPGQGTIILPHFLCPEYYSYLIKPHQVNQYDREVVNLKRNGPLLFFT